MYFNCLYTVLQLPCNIADEVLSYYWRYPHSMRRKVYKTVRCPSVRLSHLPAAVACGGFAAANIDAIQHGIYFHSVIVHQRNFVDPHDPDVDTECVENIWMRAKWKLQREFGTSRE